MLWMRQPLVCILKNKADMKTFYKINYAVVTFAWMLAS